MSFDKDKWKEPEMAVYETEHIHRVEEINKWKWLCIGMIISLFTTAFGFVTAAVFWYG